VLFAHGARNMIGWFGGNGFSNTMQYFTETVGLAYMVGFLVICLQFFGAIFIVIGFSTRLIALGILGMFIGMIVTVHLPYGFFMNWFGNSAGEGFEYHILVIGICSALLVLGGGAWSLDRKLTSLLSQ
jgi:putative oxidoreductase